MWRAREDKRAAAAEWNHDSMMLMLQQNITRWPEVQRAWLVTAMNYIMIGRAYHAARLVPG